MGFFRALEFISPRTHWPRFAWLLVALFVCRGVATLCVFPPFAAWDEYQHVGYVAYIAETGKTPLAGEATLPRAYLWKVSDFPQPPNALLTGLAGTGALDYGPYWALGHSPKSAHPTWPVPLYEAQHPPLYYWLAAPVYRACGGADNLRRSVAVLRLLNVLLVAAALRFFLAWLASVCRDRRYAGVIGLWVAAHPLYLLNAVRVANDPLAVCLGAVFVVGCLGLRDPRHGDLTRGRGPRFFLAAAALGLILGLGVLAKAIDLVLVPFAAIVFALMPLRGRATLGRAAAAGGLLLLAATAVTFYYFRFNLAHYGVLTPMQEAVDAHRAGRTLADYTRWAHLSLWKDVWWRWWVTSGLWVGGWNFLQPADVFVHLYSAAVLLSLLSWPLAWLFRRDVAAGPRGVFTDPWVVPLAIAVCGFVNAGMTYHGFQSLAASEGRLFSTMPWYAEVAMPWFLLVVCRGALAWRNSRLGAWPALAAPVLMAATESHGLLGRMNPLYSGLSFNLPALARLATLQPHWLGTATFLSAGMAAVTMFWLAWLACAAPDEKLDPAFARGVKPRPEYGAAAGPVTI